MRYSRRVYGIVLLVVLLLIQIPVLLFAQEVAQPSPIGAALKGLIANDVIPLIVAIVSGLIGVLLLKVRQRFNIQIAAETEKWISAQAETAVQMVAEKAAAKIKYDNIRLSKNQKLDMAIASLISKVPALTKEQADAYIHAAIARIPSLGSTKEAVR